MAPLARSALESDRSPDTGRSPDVRGSLLFGEATPRPPELGAATDRCLAFDCCPGFGGVPALGLGPVDVGGLGAAGAIILAVGDWFGGWLSGSTTALATIGGGAIAGGPVRMPKPLYSA